MNSTREWIAVAGLGGLGVVICALSLEVGASTVRFVDLFRWIGGELPADSTTRLVLVQLRLPRTVGGFLIGGGLAVAGLALQGIFRNPMAAPGVLGISSGGALGAILILEWGLVSPTWAGGAAFVCALGTVWGVVRIGSVHGRTPITTLLLAGMAVNALFTALIGLVLSVINPHRLGRLLFWLLGGLDGLRWPTVAWVTVPILVGAGGLWVRSRGLNVLSTGEGSARSMGVEVEGLKRWVLALVALITAAAVSSSGVIGFVGLIVPHAGRMLIGPDHRVLFPYVFVAGGLFLVGADVLARWVIQPAELRVGILTALAGVPFFLYLLRSRELRWVDPR